MSWNAGLRGFRQVDETRLVGRAWGELPLYYTLGSDPALWPAGERRERGSISRMIKDIIIHIVEATDGPKGNLSVIPAALSRSRGALSPAGP